MQKAKSSISGEYHPIIENTFSTQTLDSLSPAQAKLQSSAHHFSSNILAKRNTINSTAGIDNGMTLRSMTRGSISMGADANEFINMATTSGAKFPELVAAQMILESAGGTALSGTNNFLV